MAAKKKSRAPKGDFAKGERQAPVPDAMPDFARGERGASNADEEGPDFARGERTSPVPDVAPDFARGEHEEDE